MNSIKFISMEIEHCFLNKQTKLRKEKEQTQKQLIQAKEHIILHPEEYIWLCGRKKKGTVVMCKLFSVVKQSLQEFGVSI